MGQSPGLCGKIAFYALSLGLDHSPVARGWHIEALPPPPHLPMGLGSSPLPQLFCQLGEIGLGEFTGLRAVSWIFPTPSSWHPGQNAPPHLLCLWAGPNRDPSHPFGRPESKVTSRRRDGELVLFSASFLPLQGSEGAGQGFRLSFGQPSKCTRGPLDDIQQRGEKFGHLFWLSLKPQEGGDQKVQNSGPLPQLQPISSAVLHRALSWQHRPQGWGPGPRELTCPSRGQTHLGSAVQGSPGHSLASLNCELVTPLSPGHSAEKS